MAELSESYWLRHLTTRRLSRRQVLAVGGVGAGAALLAACGSNNSASKRSSTAGTTGPVAGVSGTGSAETPKRGGVAVTTYQYDPPTLDVHTQAAIQAWYFAASIYNGIVRYTWKTPWTIAPDLAKSWEMTPDGLQYTFHLNSGVKWSDGSDFSSADPAFNLQKVTSPKVAPQSAAFGQPLAPVLDKVSTPDATTLVLQLKAPFPALLDVLAENAAKIYKQAIYDQEQQEKQFVGTGPYLLKQYTKSQVMEYSRNPNYFKPGLPYLDGIKRLYIPTVPGEVSALGTGQIMVNTLWPGLSPSQLKTIQNTAGNKASLQSLPENTLERVFVNVTQAPFNDPRVRQAVNLAIDRQDVVTRALEGAGVIGVLDPRESGNYALPLEQVTKFPGYRQPKDQDYADAKKLLAAAGYADGLDFEFLVRSTAAYVPIAQVVQQSLAKAGLRAKLNQQEAAAGVVLQAQGKFAMAITGGGSHFNDPFLSLSVLLSGQYSSLNDPNVEGAIRKGASTVAAGERQQMARDIQTYLATKDTASFPIAWDSTGVFIWNQLKNYYPETDIGQGQDFEQSWLA